MAFRLYLTPAIGAGTSSDPRVPKYFAALDVSWSAMDYGFQPLFLVAADLSVADDAAIIANADINAFPFDLDSSVGGGNVTAARNMLEAAFIPAQWINGSMQWREVARIVAGMFQYMQRLNYVLGNVVLIDSAAKLNVQWSAIPSEYQQAIISAATSLGYATAFITANTQLRIILKNFSDQWGSSPFMIGQFSF